MYKGRGSLFTLRNKEGKVLLQHRDENAPSTPNHWGFFGGGIEKDETPEQAVKREAKEELDIKIEDIKFFKRYELHKKDELYEYFIFVAPLKNTIGKLKKQQKEGQNLGLFSYEELKDLKIVKNDRIILKDLFNKKRK